ncbi:MAG: winged helix-turn-helix transcriptional regulator [Phycisphaerales bacterium]|nr:MAG: winged helix-turn-helix transcriptional regulator [Phycisphaerales bacterium]
MASKLSRRNSSGGAKKRGGRKAAARAKRAQRQVKSGMKSAKKGEVARRKRGVAARHAAGAGTFSKLAKRDGCGAMLVAGEHVDGVWDQAHQKIEIGGGVRKSRKGGASTKTLEGVCHAMGALGHPSRIRMMVKMLEGPATYRALQKVTKHRAGPLYHHVNQLRLAGLILPKQRDLYELTRGGRNLMLVAMAAGPLIRDRRRRPVAKG